MDFNTAIIDEFRTNRGDVQTMGFGDRLIVVHSIGARSGKEHQFPVAAMPTEGGWLIAASKAGAPDNPAWFHNLLANPDVDIEVPDATEDDGIGTVAVTANRLEGEERDGAYEQFKAASSAFADYETKAAPRVIPVFHLTRR